MLKIRKFSLGVVGGLLAFATVGMTERTEASTVGYDALGNYILTTTAAKLPVGSVVELGTFTSSFNFAANATNYATTNAAFTLYATTTIGASGSGTTAGQFSAASGNLDSTTAPGKQLYIWVFNSSTPANATAWAIVTDNASNWFGPAAGAQNSTQLDTSDPAVFIPAGALGTRVTDNTTPSPDHFSIQLGVVPEPSTYALMTLAGCAVCAAYGRKRRSAGLV